MTRTPMTVLRSSNRQEDGSLSVQWEITSPEIKDVALHGAVFNWAGDEEASIGDYEDVALEELHLAVETLLPGVYEFPVIG